MPDQFWNLTWYEWNMLCERYEYEEEKPWTHTRFLGSLITGGYCKKPVPAEKLIYLPRIDEGRKERNKLEEEVALQKLEKAMDFMKQRWV